LRANKKIDGGEGATRGAGSGANGYDGTTFTVILLAMAVVVTEEGRCCH
jgi:hypothetical protein